MKVFVIGSKSSLEPKETESLDRFCRNLGSELGASDHQIILCSAWPTSADYQVLQGMASSQQHKTPKKLIVHRPDDDLIKKEWRELERTLGLVDPVYVSHTGPTFRDAAGGIGSREGLRMSFLLCQMAALKDCDVVVTVGGRMDGPAAVMLAVAREQRVPILPFRFLRGAAEKVYNQIEGELRRRLESDTEKLSDEEDGAAAILAMITRLQSKAVLTTPPRVFLSYSWKRGEYADLVEAILRWREDVFVFRDENKIRAGESISNKISYELRSNARCFWHYGVESMSKVRIAMMKCTCGITQTVLSSFIYFALTTRDPFGRY